MAGLRQSAAAAAATRLCIVPVAPGGERDDPPVYETGAIEGALFAIYLDPELGAQDYGAYLADRTKLCQASYEIELYEISGASGELPSDPLARVSAGYPLTELLGAGREYAWRAVATLDDGGPVAVSSALLYFRTAPAPNLAPELLSAAGRDTAMLLQRLEAEQRRSGRGLKVSLAGMRAYETYPLASSSYACVPLGSELDAPYPDQLRGQPYGVALLEQIGALMNSASSAQDALVAGSASNGVLGRLGAGLQGLVQSLEYGPQLRGATDFSALASQVAAAEGLSQPEQLAQIGQLLLSLDSFVGYGTIDLRQNYQDSFLGYAAATDLRLQELGSVTPYLATLLGSGSGDDWGKFIEDQRAALALLREEVQRGRLAKGQLAQRVRENRGRMLASLGSRYSYLDGATCAVNEMRVKRLTAADAPQVRKLEQEVIRCRMSALAAAIWPDV